MKTFRRIGIVCLTMLVLIMAVSAVMHGAGKSSGKAELQEHWAGGMLPEDSPVSSRSYWRHWLAYGAPRELRDGKLTPGSYRYGIILGGQNCNQAKTAPPPQGWPGADFDDSSWPVVRIPMNSIHMGGICQQMVRQTHLRTRFIVPDPAKVKKLVFTSVFHGGLIVWVNGKEVARKHIPPDGPLAKEGFAEPFPEEVYRPVSDEMKELGKHTRKAVSRGNWYSGEILPIYKAAERYKSNPGRLKIAKHIRKLVDRRIKVEVPREVLRKGVNVLALEVRLSPVHTIRLHRCSYGGWPHGALRFVTLDATPDDAIQSADARPEGIQVWADDVHRRVMTEDFLEPGVKARSAVRILGARGSRYSGQVLVGTTKELATLSARAEDLSGPGGARIPATAVSLRWGRPLDVGELEFKSRELIKKGRGREFRPSMCLTMFRYRKEAWACREREDRLCYPAPAPLFQRGSLLVLGRYGVQKLDPWKEFGKGLMLYDQLSEKAPGKVPAGSCQPLWVTVETPADAKPGLYSGKLTVSAGGKETHLTVQLQVFDWKLPAPKEFTFYTGIEQCPWSLAKTTGAKLWSEEHWKLVEASLKWAGRLGARVCVLPVVQDSEVENGKDTMMKWVKKPDGSYDYDFSVADRYLKLWQKYCHPESDVIVHILGATKWTTARADSRPGKVVVRDPATGKETPFAPIKKEVTPEGIKLWVDCCKAVREHLEKQGIADKHILFGVFHDKVGEINTALINAVNETIPGQGWARTSHYGGKKGAYTDEAGKKILNSVKWDTAIRGAQEYVKGGFPPFKMSRKDLKTYRVSTHKGWKNPDGPLSNSMGDNDVTGLTLLAPAWQLRTFSEAIITTAYRGFAQACLDGQERRPLGYGPFLRWLVYPTSEGVDGSARFEIMREGLQQAEARIFLEGCDKLPEDVQAMLDRRTERAWSLPSILRDGGHGAEYYGGWQESSWDLYAATARMAGGKVPSEEEKKRFFGR